MGSSGASGEIRSKIKKEFYDEIKNEIYNDIKNEIINEAKKNLEKEKRPEVLTGHRPLPVNIMNKVTKAVCKITIANNEMQYGTGFFLNFLNSLKYLVTNYHVINKSLVKKEIIIEIHNNKQMKLEFNNRFTRYFEKPKDIAMIEIKESDEIYQDIEFLDYDTNYINRGYEIYQDADIFSIGYPKGGTASCASGMIKEIEDYEFTHNISTEVGSSGCPIILLNNNINLIQVIGIHKEGNYRTNLNIGTFIGEILKELNEENKQNYILAEISIKDDDINKDIRILNSYEEYAKVNRYDIEECYKNEEEIKKCQIEIDDKPIEFNFFHKFELKGNHRMKYWFKNNTINKTCFMFANCSSLTNIDLSNFKIKTITNLKRMFSECSSLTNIDLSNFNTNNVTDMSFMFVGCSSLTNIDLSNFNTNNVTDIGYMFRGCSSLTNLDLSNFNYNNVTNMKGLLAECSSLTSINLSNSNTNNVTDISFMFARCSSLTNINLSNFNTDNVTTMRSLFSFCSSLTNINLSDFNTNNVTNMVGIFLGCTSLTSVDLSNFNTKNVDTMYGMFRACSSLTNLDLSNFNTNNVTNMGFMFFGCSSLTNLNLYNFNSNKVTDMELMFDGCSSLIKQNLITKDKKILNQNLK